MGGVEAGVARKRVDHPPDRSVLQAGQGVGQIGCDQVGAAHRAVQQRSAGEQRTGTGTFAVAVLGHVVAEMVLRVAGSRHHSNRERAHFDDVAVAHATVIEGQDLCCGVQVGGAGAPGQGEPAGDIVVMQVGLGDVGDGDHGVVGGRQHAVEVPLGIDDQRHLAVVHQVAAVPERWCLDGLDVHGGSFRSVAAGRPTVRRSQGTQPQS